MSYFDGLKKVLLTYLDKAHVAQVEKAYRVARDAHRGQKRRSGESYITHPVAAALELAKMHLDHQSIMATLLHDVIEDTSVSKDDLREAFGEEVADLVDGVSKLTQIEFETRAQEQAENFRKMVLAMVRDIRVIIVKLADRLHNMRTLGVMPTEKKRRIAQETLEIYAPIANRIGIHQFYIELEDLGFKALYPLRYRILSNAVDKARKNRSEILETIYKSITEKLKTYQLEDIEILGRKKHLYSIYKKMKIKNMSFSEIMDVYAFRIIVDTSDNCYRVLGAIHQCYKPLPERFKDYIAIPKANGYQSLHTTLFGPYGVPIEVQIRTHEMDSVAEHGIAAHWSYKSTGEQVDASQMRARAWVKSLLEMQQSSGSSLEFIETVKIDLFPDEVYVFTPRGHIMELPRGATAVDFAYMVHSDIGNSCIAVKLDRHLAPLGLPLKNGQTVEIITAPGASPNPAWLNFVVTGKARSNIRHYLKSQQHQESMELGRRLLDNALKQFHQSLDQIAMSVVVGLATQLDYENLDAFYEDIGLGNQVALVIARRLIEQLESSDGVLEEEAPRAQGLRVKGTEGMVLTFAECCRPIPGDTIVGCLVQGRGVIVHDAQCPSVKGFCDKPERFIHMSWQDQVQGEFKVDIEAHLLNQRGVLAEIAQSIASTEANIDNISVKTGDGQYQIVQLTLTVRDRVHLARVMRRLRTIKTVVRLYRLRG